MENYIPLRYYLFYKQPRRLVGDYQVQRSRIIVTRWQLETKNSTPVNHCGKFTLTYFFFFFDKTSKIKIGKILLTPQRVMQDNLGFQQKTPNSGLIGFVGIPFVCKIFISSKTQMGLYLQQPWKIIPVFQVPSDKGDSFLGYFCCAHSPRSWGSPILTLQDSQIG